MRILELDPRQDSRWDEFISAHPGGTVFHTSAWCNVLVDTYGYEPRYFATIDAGSAITSGLATMLVRSRLTGRRLVGLPFSDYCAPLGDDARALVDEVRARVDGRLKYAEIRGGFPGGSPVGFRESNDLVVHSVDLTPEPSSILASLASSARRGIKKAQREGVVVRVAARPDDMKEFYQLHTATRRKHGLVPQPWPFFANIHTHFVSHGSGFLLLAYSRDQLVAGDLLLRHGPEIVYKFNASDDRFLGARPNNALTWAAILLGRELGCRSLSLGRCELSNEGLLRFKRLWATSEEALPYCYYPEIRGATAEANSSSLRYRLMTRVFRLTPTPLLPPVGAAIYRHLG